MIMMRFISSFALASIATSPIAAGGQQARIQHVVVRVGITNDDWTTSGLTIAAGDMIILSAPSTIHVGAMTGEVDSLVRRSSLRMSLRRRHRVRNQRRPQPRKCFCLDEEELRRSISASLN